MTGTHRSCIDVYIIRRHFLLHVFYKSYHMYLSILSRRLSKSLHKSHIFLWAHNEELERNQASKVIARSTRSTVSNIQILTYYYLCINTRSILYTILIVLSYYLYTGTPIYVPTIYYTYIFLNLREFRLTRVFHSHKMRVTRGIAVL